MRNEDSGHMVEVKHHHEGRYEEHEPSDSDVKVDYRSGSFVLLVHFVLVVYMVGCHLQTRVS